MKLLHFFNVCPYKICKNQTVQSDVKGKQALFTQKSTSSFKPGYPNCLINEEMSKLKFDLNMEKKESSNKGVPFVVTYHPMLKSLWKII